MRAWVDALLAILLSPICAACSRPLAEPTRGCVCEGCWRAVDRFDTFVCRSCGDPTAPGLHGHDCPHPAGTSAIDWARAVGPHTGSLRAIVHALKYDGRRSIAPRLAALMREAVADIPSSADIVVPVPLHPARRRERGFNQADDLARHIGLPVRRALRRTRRTESQATLNAADRHANVHGAFALSREHAGLRGVSILLVDDVRTTGATLEACARVLKEAGVRDVAVVTAARVAPPRP